MKADAGLHDYSTQCLYYHRKIIFSYVVIMTKIICVYEKTGQINNYTSVYFSFFLTDIDHRLIKYCKVKLSILGIQAII